MMDPMVDLALARIRERDYPAAEEAIASVSNECIALQLRGGVALAQRQWITAHDLLQQALLLEPGNPTALYNLGQAQVELGLFHEARKSFETVVLADLGAHQAWHKLGATHGFLGNWCEALACFERAQAFMPDSHDVHQSLAMIQSTFCLDEQALESYRRATALNPDYVQSQVGEAATLIRMGRWLEGWPKFEARWKLPIPVAPWWYRGQPLYHGDLEGMRGKRVLLRSEQGFGDSIHFARYIEPLTEIAGSVVVETQQELVRLFEHFPVKILVAPRMENQVRAIDTGDFDVQTSLMSLPLLFGTTPETVPPPVRLKVEPKDSGPRIGLCWAGGPRHEDPQAHAIDVRRSIDPKVFQAIADACEPLGGAIALQQDQLPECRDWYDTACVVAGLDLVITVDTAICHLAASLGVETWMLSRRDCCWRWSVGKAETPWYPSMRILHQPALGDWASVIKRVVCDLKERADA